MYSKYNGCSRICQVTANANHFLLLQLHIKCLERVKQERRVCKCIIVFNHWAELRHHDFFIIYCHRISLLSRAVTTGVTRWPSRPTQCVWIYNPGLLVYSSQPGYAASDSTVSKRKRLVFVLFVQFTLCSVIQTAVDILENAFYSSSIKLFYILDIISFPRYQSICLARLNPP